MLSGAALGGIIGIWIVSESNLKPGIDDRIATEAKKYDESAYKHHKQQYDFEMSRYNAGHRLDRPIPPQTR